MDDTDLDRDTGRPVGLIIVVGLLAIIGAFTVFGWFFGTLAFLFKLAVLGVVVFAVVTAIRVLVRR